MKKISNNYRTIIPGFMFAGVSAGIKPSGEKDVALIYSECPANVAGVFTTNRIKAAPVKISINQITAQKGQAIIINSGNANACTGRQGIKDAKEIKIKTAKMLGISPELVYVSSTGIIGSPLPMKKIKKALPELTVKLSPSSLNQAASAIMTTDTFLKIYSNKIEIGGRKGTIAGFAKGAGMICPKMATMLCYIVTDIAIKPKPLDLALREAVKKSFNRLIIDNDMSTNDTVMVMANGLLGNTPITKSSIHYHKFKKALDEVTYNLAKMIAKDGEGATKFIEIIVKGAKTESDAEKVGRSVANSMLVKTAIHGKNANWGRIMAAIGYSGVKANEQKIDIFFDKLKVVNKGSGIEREKIASKILSKKEIIITIDLRAGEKTAKIFTCDLTEKYIKINAHYRT